MKKYLSISIMSVLALTLVNCSSHNVALEDARKSYQEASNDPTITKNAQVEMHDAKEALKKAEMAKDEGRNEKDVTHLATLTQSRVEIARVEAQKKTQETKFKEVTQSRSDAVIAARERENKQLREQSNRREEEREDTRNQNQAERKMLDEKNQALQKELAALKMKPTERGMELDLRDTVFEFGKSELTPGARRDLERISMELGKTQGLEILVEGHTDSIGTDSFNQDLSQRRAESVRQVLQRNVDRSNIQARGLGKEYPIASNATEAGRQQNRRVTIVVLSDDNTRRR